MIRTLVVLIVLVAGCGGVTAEQLATDGGAPDHEAGASVADAGTAAEAPTDRTTEAPSIEAPVSCSTAERCAACAPYPCAAVVACASSGDAGNFPWQSCHNTNANPADVDGLHCAMKAACP